jgi:hypothetical protein
MEAPIAAALGKLDGLNLFDPYWMDPEYDLWYQLLNCGIRLPASTGSDWFVCSSNRVYVEAGTNFSYPLWLARLREGRSFVTDGPILDLRVEGHRPSNDPLDGGAGADVELVVEWHSMQPIERLEIVRDGEVVMAIDNAEQRLHGHVALRVDASDAGWLAARCWGHQRTSFGHPLWAHTSPIYLRSSPDRARQKAAAGLFVERIGAAQEWLASGARFAGTSQRDRMLALFAEGRLFYERLMRG